MSLEDDPVTLNWTSKAEACDPGELCQETVLLISAGKMRTKWWVSLPGASLLGASGPAGLKPSDLVRFSSAFPSFSSHPH